MNAFYNMTLIAFASGLLLLLPGCMDNKNSAQLEANKAMMQAYADGFNARDWEELKTLFAADYDYVTTPGVEGPDGLVEYLKGLADGFDAKFELVDVVAEGNKVAFHGKASGTHVRDFGGIPATGKAFNLNAVGIVTIKEGKIASEVEVFEELQLMQLIGAMPEQPSEPAAAGE